MDRLFDIDVLETNPNYVEPKKIRKWNEALKKYILDVYDANDGRSSYMMCGYMCYCKKCVMRHCNGCSDCLIAIKKFCKDNFVVIDYDDYDFGSFIMKLENIKK